MSNSFWNSPVMSNLLQPWCLIVIAVAGFLFFFTMGKISKHR